MKMLKITSCRDPLMWYADKVGQLVEYCGKWPEAYKSREDAGYINRVEFEDAEVVERETEDDKFTNQGYGWRAAARAIYNGIRNRFPQYFEEGK